MVTFSISLSVTQQTGIEQKIDVRLSFLSFRLIANLVSTLHFQTGFGFKDVQMDFGG